MKTAQHVLAAASLMFLGFSRLAGQVISRDQANGDFLINYTVEGRDYVARVPSSDRIAPSVRLRGLDGSGTVLQYRYQVSNLRGTAAAVDRGIFLVGLPCAGVDSSASPALGSPVGWRGTVVARTSGAPVCRFVARPASVLAPGDSVDGISVRSVLLPAIGSISTAGVYDPEQIPSGEETPDTIYRLINSIHRRVVRVRGIVPSRSPTANPTVVVGYLKDDLETACGDLLWVDDQGICRSLQAKVDAARAALGRTQPNPAKNQLVAFRAELNAQRGKHVNENAYFLLSVLADHAVSLLH
jgi:hypothetical protein